MGSWTEKMNQWLIVLDLAETWGLAPRAQSSQPSVKASSMESGALSWSLWVLHFMLPRLHIPAKHPNT